MGMVLLFNVNVMKADRIAGLCRELGHSVKPVSRKDYRKTVGGLMGLSERAARAADEDTDGLPDELPDEMMIIGGMEREILDVFLERYKAAGIPSIMRKAVVTDTNSSWDVLHMFDEMEQNVQKQLRGQIRC